jgi:hypothetical protein
MDVRRQILESALAQLKPHIASGRIVGSGGEQFLLVERGQRSVEIYGTEETGITIDPAIGGQLQGEITYPSFARALGATVSWLQGCRFEELLAERDEPNR